MNAGAAGWGVSSNPVRGTFFFCLFLTCLLSAAADLKAQPRRPPPGKTKATPPASRPRVPASNTLQATSVAAQVALAPVKILLEQNRLPMARQAIDDYLNNPRNPRTAEAWYLKGKVYSAVVNDPKRQATLPNGRRQSLEAFRKSLETDRNQAVMLLTVDGYQPVFALYTGAYQQGVDLYNTERYDPALSAFREAATAGDFIFTQGWGLSRIDTALSLYIGLAAYRAGRAEEALPSFQKLADASITEGQDYATAYRFLAKYHFDRKDASGLARYIHLGQTLFPQDEYFPLLDIEWSRVTRDFRSVFEKYERLLAREPDRYEAVMDYANELFGYTHEAVPGHRDPDYATHCTRIETLYRRSTRLRPESDEAWLSLGKHFYNQALVLDQEALRMTGKSRDDDQRRAALWTRSASLASQAIPALEQVFRRHDGKKDLSAAQTIYYRSACSLLSYCHALKKEYPAADAYRERFEATK